MTPVVSRYALGIVICSLSAVVVVVIFIGVLCGAIGFRRNKNLMIVLPYLTVVALHCYCE